MLCFLGWLEYAKARKTVSLCVFVKQTCDGKCTALGQGKIFSEQTINIFEFYTPLLINFVGGRKIVRVNFTKINFKNEEFF